MKRRRMLFAAGVAVLSMLMVLSNTLMLQAAEAIDASQKCVLALKFHGASEENPVSDVKVHLYRVAEIDASGSYTLAGDFSKLSISLSNDLSSSEWNNLAVTLKAYTESEQIAAQETESTGTDGIASFPNLSVGLYLVTADNTQQEGTTYAYQPVLIAMPYLNEKKDDWVYDSSSSPVAMKGEVKSVSKKYTVVKQWSDAGSSSRPSSVTVNLIKNGAVDSTVTLNDGDSWTYSWYDGNVSDTWEVSEANVPSGYTVSLSSSTASGAASFVLTNTCKPTVPVPTPSASELPFTGQHWVPAMILAAGGLGLLTAGLLLIRRHD